MKKNNKPRTVAYSFVYSYVYSCVLFAVLWFQVQYAEKINSI